MLGTDQNLDLLETSQHQNIEIFLDICLEYKMIQSIYWPTSDLKWQHIYQWPAPLLLRYIDWWSGRSFPLFSKLWNAF